LIGHATAKQAENDVVVEMEILEFSNMKHPMHKFLPAIMLATLLTSCGRQESRPAKEVRHEPATFAESSFFGLTPMMDGSVYAHDVDERLWYVKDGQAVQVTTSAGPVPHFDDITPSADGSAYATSLAGGLWRLVSGSATRVTEGHTASTSPRPSLPYEAGAFALYVSERKRRLAAEDREIEAEGRAEDAAAGSEDGNDD
jgi:hypothetical protein